MKNPSRLLALVLAGSLGLTPLYSACVFRYDDTKKKPWTVDIADKPIELTQAQMGGVILTVGAIVSAIVLAVVGKARKAKLDKIIAELRVQFPNYTDEALRFAATAKLIGLRRLIRLVAFTNLAQFKNPKRQLRKLSGDFELLRATAFATGNKFEAVGKALENSSLLHILNPF